MTVERREPGSRDVVLDVLYCGICHSDIHQARDEWGGGAFPMVPGHEIVGRVAQVGAQATKFKVGELAGAGCMVDSCHACARCQEDLEQFCEKGMAGTYNSTEMDRKTPTYGGYSTRIVLDERAALRIPQGLDPAAAAPLLCAGITTYSPLRQAGQKHWHGASPATAMTHLALHEAQDGKVVEWMEKVSGAQYGAQPGKGTTR